MGGVRREGEEERPTASQQNTVSPYVHVCKCQLSHFLPPSRRQHSPDRTSREQRHTSGVSQPLGLGKGRRLQRELKATY